MKTSRQRILEFIELKKVVSAQEIASAMHMTTANARHHLRTLLESGVVVIAGQRQSISRGRPEQLYQLAHQAEAHNLSVLSATLLAQSLRDLNENEKNEFVSQVASAILSQTELPRATTLGLRLQNAVRKLNQMNYQARWEARATSPRLIFGHCPYRAILDQFPELCTMDKFIASRLSGSQMEQIAKLELASPGLRHCIFQVRDK